MKEFLLRRGEFPSRFGTQNIQEKIVERLKRVKTGKAPEPNNLLVEAWKALRSEGVDILWNLMDKIFIEEKVPEIWRQSTLIPILKEIETFSNVKIMRHKAQVTYTEAS